MRSTHHHIKAYIFFLIVSIILVGILVFLYSPTETTLLRSGMFASSEVDVEAPREVRLMSEEVSPDALKVRRIRLTNMLIRYQSELREMEASSATNSSEDATYNMQNLRLKIENLERMITELAR